MKKGHCLTKIAGVVASIMMAENVIGYITQWEAWKGTNAGFSVKGEATHLNVDMDIYSILNFSFFGVAKVVINLSISREQYKSLDHFFTQMCIQVGIFIFYGVSLNIFTNIQMMSRGMLRT